MLLVLILCFMLRNRGVLLFLCLFVYVVSFGQESYSRQDDYVKHCDLVSEYEPLFALGLKLLKEEGKANMAGRVFLKVLDGNSSSCDASFLIGVALTLQEEHAKALPYYYMADSLAISPNTMFKQELAEASLRVNNIGFARVTYERMLDIDKANILGYIGLAITATSLGDYDKGLNSLASAELLVSSDDMEALADINFLKGILLVLNKEFLSAINVLEALPASYRTSKDYYIHYIIANYELYKLTAIDRYKLNTKKALEAARFYKEEIKPTFFEKYQL